MVDQSAGPGQPGPQLFGDPVPEKHAGPPPFEFPPVFAEWLASLPPVDRARVAAALSDRRAQPQLAAIAGEAVFGLTRGGGGGLSHSEIAGLLGCGQDAVARRVLRHRKAVGLTRSGESGGTA